MSILSKLGMAFGVGNADLMVEVSEGPWFRGATVPVSVVVKGGTDTQEIRKLTAELVEFWVTGTGKSRSYHRHRRVGAVLSEGVVVGHGDEHRFEGSLTLPETARCSRRRDGWLVHIEADIPLAVNPKSECTLKVIPQPEILAIQRAVRDQFAMVQESWDGSAPEVYYRFDFKTDTSGDFDGVALKLGVTESDVVGTIHFLRQARGLSGIFSALTGGNSETVPLTIPRAELLTKRGSPNPVGAAAYLLSAWDSVGCPRP